MKNKDDSIIKKVKSFFRNTKKTINEIKEKKENQLEKLDQNIIDNDCDIKKNKENEKIIKVEISVQSVVKSALAIIGILLFLYLLFLLRSTIILLLVSVILAIALNPIVDFICSRKIPRGIAILIIYIIFFFLLFIVIYNLIPLIAQQISKIAINITAFINEIIHSELEYPFKNELEPYLALFFDNMDRHMIVNQIQNLLYSFSADMTNIAGNLLNFIYVFISNLFNAFLVLILTFFMLLKKTHISTFLDSLIPKKYAKYYSNKVLAVQNKLGAWVRGQLSLMFIVSLANYIGLWILAFIGIDIEYKETLALVSGFTEIIPYLGPVLGALPAILIAINHSWIAVIAVIILYTLVQQLENNIFAPIIMGKKVGLNPIVVIIAIIIGGQFFGFLGIVLAIPITATISIFVEEYAKKNKCKK